jgi:hypothetical protein
MGKADSSERMFGPPYGGAKVFLMVSAANAYLVAVCTQWE